MAGKRMDSPWEFIISRKEMTCYNNSLKINTATLTAEINTAGAVLPDKQSRHGFVGEKVLEKSSEDFPPGLAGES